MLSVEELDAGYGEAQILFGVALSVGEGEVVTLLGRTVVVLPMPLRPSSVTTSPSPTERSTPNRICASP